MTTPPPADLMALSDRLDEISDNIARANLYGFGNQVRLIADDLRNPRPPLAERPGGG